MFKQIMVKVRNYYKQFTDKTIHNRNQYNCYVDYLEHQKLKTTDPKRIEKWLGHEWVVKLEGFKEIFIRNEKYIKGKKKAICLGARTGQEVKALLDLGINAIGIDLVSFPPYTIVGDIHNLSFKNGEFDFAFTNIFDHSLYPDKFCAEMERVVQKKGIIIMHLQIGIESDEYAETIIYSPDAVIDMFKNVAIKESRKINNSFDSMNWELVIEVI